MKAKRFGALVGSAAFVAGLAYPAVSGADVTTVTADKGGAYGYFVSVSLFGGPPNVRGPAPTVSLPSGGSRSPVTATQPSASATVGPSIFFSSRQLDVSTQGNTGLNGSVNTSTNIVDVNTSGQESFTATNVASSCTATKGGGIASASITDGTLMTDNGDSTHSPVTVAVPATPAPNTVFNGVNRLSDTSQDTWQYTFNEQTVNPDGSITVFAGHQHLIGPTAVGDVWIGRSDCGVTTAAQISIGRVADFDGDSRTDLSVYRPSSGVWLPKLSSTGNLAQTYFGATGDIPLPGDYDGVGTVEPAVYRPSTGAWFVRNSNTSTVTQAYFGNAADDIPIPADYDGDGKVDLAVYRPSAGLWLIKQSSNAVVVSRYFGATGTGDVPVPADYTGDGKADVAIYRQAAGLWFVVDSTSGTVTQTKWGNSSDDMPVPGLYDSDGKADIAVFRPSSGAWFVINSTGSTTQQYWGSPGDVPVPGFFDIDTRTDFAVFRRSIGAWFIFNSSGGTSQAYWGNTTNDIPLPLPYAVRHQFFPAL
jgi:hypothetical protein